MELGLNCRSGCKTKNHRTWGECAANSGIGVGAGETSKAFMAGKVDNTEIESYIWARSQGIQPAATSLPAIKDAIEKSQKADKAYDATNNTFKD